MLPSHWAIPLFYYAQYSDQNLISFENKPAAQYKDKKESGAATQKHIKCNSLTGSVYILYVWICYKGTLLYFTAKTQYRKYETNISKKGILWLQSQFPHSCVCERFFYSHDQSAYSAAEKYLDQSWKSLEDTWMWKLGLRPHNSQKRNTWTRFSLQCGFRINKQTDQEVENNILV